MQYLVNYNLDEKSPVDYLVVPLFSDKKFSPNFERFGQDISQAIEQAINNKNIKIKHSDQLLWIDLVDHLSCKKLVLISCGKTKSFSINKLNKLIKIVSNFSKQTDSKNIAIDIAGLSQAKSMKKKLMQYLVSAFESNSYQFKLFKKKEKNLTIKSIQLIESEATDIEKLEQQLNQAISLNKGIKLCKNLANMPGNICTPEFLAETSLQMAKKYKLVDCQLLQEDEMSELKMNAFLSVSKGSAQAAKLIELSYNGAEKDQQPIVLIGKGVTFDSGGISLKPGAAMDEMKYDMCGAASVIGTIKAIADMQIKLNVIGLIPATENLPDGLASKPGDIVTSMSGKTIEILNTDAEGRLILCDTLTYAEKFNPSQVIDIATLTGACIIALGHHAAAIFGNNKALLKKLRKAGESSNDRVWELPIWQEYHQQLSSNFADLANIGGRSAGSITAACFLSQFAKKYKWAHIDIAGVAWQSGTNKGATGKPVSLLVDYLADVAK